MNKKKVLKTIGIIVLIAFILFLIHVVRNYVIVKNLQNKIGVYTSSNNYNIKTVTKEENGTVVKMDYYKKGNRQVVFLEKELNGEKSKISMYDNGQRTDLFTETKDSKIAKLYGGEVMKVSVINGLENTNWQTLLSCIPAIIKSEEYNGHKCYVITGFLSETSLEGNGKSYSYIDKETGLLMKSVTNNIVTDKAYVFESVDDKIFAEPDISQYIVK